MKDNNSTKFFVFTLALIVLMGCSSHFRHSPLTNQDPSDRYWNKETLYYEYGSIIKLRIEIVDGSSLGFVQYRGNYLAKVLKIDGRKPESTLVFEFDNILVRGMPDNNFYSYRNLFGDELLNMRKVMLANKEKQILGRVYEVMAYETGEFIGLPEGFPENKTDSIALPFQFRNHLYIVANLNVKDPWRY